VFWAATCGAQQHGGACAGGEERHGGRPWRRVLGRRGGPRGRRQGRHHKRPLNVAAEEAVPGAPLSTHGHTATA